MSLPSRLHIQGLLPSSLNGYFEGSWGEYYHTENWDVWIDYWSAGRWTVWYWDGNDTVSMFYNSSEDEDTFPLLGWQADDGSFDTGGMVITDYSDITPYKPTRLQVQCSDGTGDGVYYSTWSGYARLGGGVAILYKNDAWVFEDTNAQPLAACPGNPWVFPLSGWNPDVLITESVGIVTISTVYELQGIQLAGFMDLSYVQTQTIDASPTNPGSGNYDSSVWSSTGFIPIGTSTKQFVGRYDGQGFHVTGLYINRHTQTGVGLFGYHSTWGMGAYPRMIQNTHLRNCYVRGSTSVGALVGVSGGSGRARDCSATGTVVCVNYSGGGLFGNCISAYLDRCWANVAVSITGTNRHSAGGFAATTTGTSILRDCYARGTVQGNSSTDNVGGFVGATAMTTRLERCYATGLASGRNNIGQFSGFSNSGDVVVTHCYWVSDNPASTSVHGTQLDTTQAKDPTNYTNFNFKTRWNIDLTETINNGYPYLDPRKAPQAASPGLYRSLYRKR